MDSLLSPSAPPQTPRWYKQRGLYLVLAVIVFLLPLATIGFVAPQPLLREPLALRSQRVLRLQAFRTTATVLVAQTSTSLLRSVDGGNSFERIDQGLPHSGLGKLQLVDWAVSNVDPSQLYALVGNPGQERLYYSTDAGKMWRIAGRLSTTQSQDGVLRSLAVAPTEFSALYVIGDRSLWHSVDGGRTWGIPSPLPQALTGTSHLAVTVDAWDPEVIFASAGTGLWRSTTGGQTWTLVGDLPPMTEIASLTQATESTRLLFAGGRGLVSVSDDGGTTWTEASLPGAQGLLRVIVVDPVVETTVLAVDESSQIFRSDDAGRQWYFVNAAPGQRILDLVVNPADRGHLIMASNDGIWREPVALFAPIPTSTPSATSVPYPTPITLSTPTALPALPSMATAIPSPTPTITPSPIQGQTVTAVPPFAPSRPAVQHVTTTRTPQSAASSSSGAPTSKPITTTEPSREPPSKDLPTATPAPPSTSMPRPTDTPVPRPTDTPVPQPTDTPVPQPTDTPVPQPTDTPVPQPTDTPVPQPTDTPVPQPTDTPLPEPTDTPAPTPEPR